VAASPPSTPASSAPRPPPSVDEFTDEPALQDVFFEPGRADIGRNGAGLMRDNARWLVENPGYLVLIESHTDYKGSREANLAMGERRAKAAANFLLKETLSSRKVWRTRSGGPSVAVPNTPYEKTDACAAKNRHVHFRVKRQ
jgi:peptidoglycan-associated lipoprotein